MKKKTYLYAVTSLILSLTLAGCGSSPDQKTETPQKTAAAEVSAVTAEPVQMKEGMKDVKIYPPAKRTSSIGAAGDHRMGGDEFAPYGMTPKVFLPCIFSPIF
ncbi:MAG: hypothetical protein IJ130_01260 [Solobacterium sp.]|nr:hypothetical protein [Solobacterium sp.]